MHGSTIRRKTLVCYFHHLLSSKNVEGLALALSQKLLDLSDVLKASNAANTSENILNVTKRSRKSDESQESKNEDYEAIASLLNETPDNLTTMSAAHVKLTQSTPFSNSVHTEGHFKTLQFDIATAAEYLELTASKYDSFHEGATNEQLDGRDSREAMSIGCQFREEGIKRWFIIQTQKQTLDARHMNKQKNGISAINVPCILSSLAAKFQVPNIIRYQLSKRNKLLLGELHSLCNF